MCVRVGVWGGVSANGLRDLVTGSLSLSVCLSVGRSANTLSSSS